MSDINFEDVTKAREHFRDLMQSQWMNDAFLTWKWWLLLFLTIVPYIIWWKIAVFLPADI